MHTLQLQSNCLYNFPHTPLYILCLGSKYSPMHQVLHPYNTTGKINNYFKKDTRRYNTLYWMQGSTSMYTYIVYGCNFFLTVLPKYFNSYKICNDANFMLHSTKSTSPNIRYNKNYLQKYMWTILYYYTISFCEPSHFLRQEWDP